jgi:RNA polymerase sigma-70 factor (ECF subfamily)
MQMLDPAAQSRNPVGNGSARCASAPGAESAALPDLLLIERARAGDERAVEALIRRYIRRLFRVAWSVLMDEERAEAAVLEGCLAAFGDLSRYELTGKFAAWLTRLTYNQARALRDPARARRDAAPGAGPMTQAAPDAAGAERRDLEGAIGRLPEAFRTVYVLRLLEGVSGIETAACLGVHETTVRTRLYRAHRRIEPGAAGRIPTTAGLLEPSPERTGRILSRAPARLFHGSIPTTSASAP